MSARDVRFGRRGGHWIDGSGTPPPPAPECRVCGRPVYVKAGAMPDVHLSCEPPPADDPQGTLL